MSWATAESLSVSRNYSLLPTKAEKPNVVNEGRSQSLSTLGVTARSVGTLCAWYIGCEAALSFHGRDASAAAARMSCGPEGTHQLRVLIRLLGSVCAQRSGATLVLFRFECFRLGRWLGRRG
jgi:hypothetical protein